MARKETPFSPEWTPAFERRRATSRPDPRAPRHHVNARQRQPLTDLQALMEAAPHEDPPESVAANLALRELLAKAVDSLDDGTPEGQRRRWIFEAHHYRGLSFRAIARELSVSKTTADRIYRDAINHLRERLT